MAREVPGKKSHLRSRASIFCQDPVIPNGELFPWHVAPASQAVGFGCFRGGSVSESMYMPNISFEELIQACEEKWPDQSWKDFRNSQDPKKAERP